MSTPWFQECRIIYVSSPNAILIGGIPPVVIGQSSKWFQQHLKGEFQNVGRELGNKYRLAMISCMIMPETGATA